jgi:hypothetical protein
MPTCPPWCVECWDLSDDLPGSRYHHSEPTPPIPIRTDLTALDDSLTVRISYCDVLPELRRPGLSDDTARIDICVNERDVAASLTPADARELALAILRRVEAIEHSPDTRNHQN